MSPIASPAIIDPLHAFFDGACIAGTKRSMPLLSTRFDVRIAHGLALVSTIRTFRNDEPESIEATITFPIPVHAVLFALEARIDGRVLNARAQRKNQARETYEQALERGKTAVLHEEVLRGVHMLSVGHIAAGVEIAVATNWSMTLTNIDGSGRLRIPLTVGEIYGRSGLPDSDDLIHGAPNLMADLTVSCSDGRIELIDGKLDGGAAKVPLNAPIDLVVSNWIPDELCGRAADGRKVLLRVEPSPVTDTALDVALLVDRSGSMEERSSGGRNDTKHDAIVRGLQDIADDIGPADAVEIWEFDDDFNHVGSTRNNQSLKAIAKRLNRPDGGTNIGRALHGVAAQTKARDVLLITDGKSHALDVQTLAQTGRRYSVVLVGEDSLEANVGYLAALTGGEIFVASGADLAEVLDQSLRSLRTPHKASGRINGAPERLSVCRGGMSISASWQRTEEPPPETIDTRAVAALAASLALPVVDAERAAELAEQEGLVTHLTSLVLVDEAASAQEGIPGTRKIALPTPRTALPAMAGAASMAMPTAAYSMAPPMIMRRKSAGPGSVYSLGVSERAASASEMRFGGHCNLSRIGESIDWDAGPDRLRNGDLSALDPFVAHAIKDAAALPEVVDLARQLGIDPVVLLVGLIAQSQARNDRTARRIAHAILGNAPDFAKLSTLIDFLHIT
jgi:hypothetical protein